MCVQVSECLCFKDVTQGDERAEGTAGLRLIKGGLVSCRADQRGQQTARCEPHSGCVCRRLLYLTVPLCVCVCMHFCVQLHVCTLNMVNADGNGSGKGHTVVCYYLQMGK